MAFGSPGSSKLNVSLATMLELQNSLRSNNVNFVVCEADSSSRLIILADALLTTSAEDKMPMRIVATVNEVSNVIADKVAASRNENVNSHSFEKSREIISSNFRSDRRSDSRTDSSPWSRR